MEPGVAYVLALEPWSVAYREDLWDAVLSFLIAAGPACLLSVLAIVMVEHLRSLLGRVSVLGIHLAVSTSWVLLLLPGTTREGPLDLGRRHGIVAVVVSMLWVALSVLRRLRLGDKDSRSSVPVSDTAGRP